VEDNPIEARLFQRALTEAWTRNHINLKFDIVHAERLERACSILETQTVDIILLDATLPDSHGNDSIERIHSLAADTPIILMTGIEDTTLVSEAIRRGAHDCLTKNRYDGAILARTIRNTVERHALRTELVRQADEISRREANFRNIVTGIRDGIVILNTDNLVQFINPETETLLNLSSSELIGQPFPYSFTTQRHLNVDIVHKDNSKTRVELRASQIQWNEKPALLVILRDISAVRELETEKHLLERRMVEGQRLETLGVMATSIVHDFNNLLTAILGSAGAARLDTPANSPLQADLTEIENSCQRASDLCQQMLAYSGGKTNALVKAIDLNSLVQETSTLLRHSISKRAQVELNYGQSLPHVLGDETQLRQIIMNLVINASEAIGGKNGKIRIATSLVTLTPESFKKEQIQDCPIPPGRYVQLEVTDNGCGMPQEIQKKIFDPFFSTKDTGRGVGLCAVSQIVKKHHGSIDVTSQQNRGTTFRIILPCTTHTRNAPALATSRQPSWTGHGTILIIDDEKGVRDAISRMLRHHGFHTILANDGEDGVAKFREHSGEISCVLLDLTMPNLDGEEACAELHKIKASIPILLMSGFAKDEACRPFEGKGISGFLQKPFNLEKLKTTLSPLLTKTA
jgi:signal transduction histidine kinase